MKQNLADFLKTTKFKTPPIFPAIQYVYYFIQKHAVDTALPEVPMYLMYYIHTF